MAIFALPLMVVLGLATSTIAFSTKHATSFSADVLDLSCGSHSPPEPDSESPFSDAAHVAPSTSASYDVRIYWNVIHKNTTYEGGFLSSAQVGTAIDVLNSHFADSGLIFQLAALQYTQNEQWFDNVDNKVNKSLAIDMKNKLHVGTAKDLNIYSVGFTNSKLGGFSTFPRWYSGAPKLDGVVFKWNTTPGGSRVKYNQGKTLVHEVGHWAGLYHTFQGGCKGGKGDHVSDTPAQVNATTGCPISRDSCPNSPGKDSTGNPMDYTYDACKTDPFTKGQIERINQVMRMYRLNETENEPVLSF
ncbi:unnamed protein product [Rhizoctonia solani]|uniref:Peptidase M43 pregnancy-associated plasma-A domain-containing protein n=1 Tax=Rhizoctonia solani TaxID=456999 RepID=A0A8H3BQY6_9AGAM|nr:unnamed protein product [Rhizoctonia solani]